MRKRYNIAHMNPTMRCEDIVFIVLFSFIFIIGVVGNSLVIYAFKRKARALSSMELVIMYLALTDLIATIFNPLLYIYWHATGFTEWHFDAFSCTLFPSVITVSVTMSLGLIQLITVERCRVLVNPMVNKLFTKKRIHGMVAVVLLLSILNEFPYIINHRLQTTTEVYEHQCTNESTAETTTATTTIRVMNTGKDNATSTTSHNSRGKAALTATTIMVKDTRSSSSTLKLLNETGFICRPVSWTRSKYCSPSDTDVYKYSRVATLLLRDAVFTLTLVTCNVLIYRSLKDPEHQILLKQVHARLNPDRTLKMLFANAIVFIFLVLPKDIFTVVYTISYLTGHHMDRRSSIDINSALKLIQKCNSIVNIFIYARLHTSFKQTLENTYPRISLRRR